MVISQITKFKDDKFLTLTAEIAFRGKPTQRAYLKVPLAYESFVSADASPFLAATLLPCMKTKENIYVDGSVSSKLLENISDIMKLIKEWNIGLYKIKIRTKKITKDTKKAQHVGSFFTAGVDSFYTYLKYRKTKEKITHLVLAHGLDIPLENKVFFEQVQKTITKVAKEEKIEAIFVETNIGAIVEQRLVWDFSHGGVLASIALFLRNGLKRMNVPGAVKKSQLFPYGTHPELDKLWSTETLQLRNDSDEYDRLDKIRNMISKSPLALSYLRVCTQNLKGQYNCSKCYKCLITMIYLTCSDALQKAKTFDKKLDLELVKKMYYDYKLKYNNQGEAAVTFLRKREKDPELQKAILYSLNKSRNTRLTKRISQIIAKWDQNHNERKLYQFVFRMNENSDRSAIFKFLFKHGLLK